MVLFDCDAEGMTTLECVNYVPQDMDVIGNLEAAKVAMERYNATIIFNGVEYDNYGELDAAVSAVLLRNEA
jgi:hypothetical protein